MATSLIAEVEMTFLLVVEVEMFSGPVEVETVNLPKEEVKECSGPVEW